MNKQDLIKNSKRVVIKIGSALLIDSKTGKLQKNWLESLAFDIHNLINSGVEVIIVSSGSIALGKKQLCLKDNLSLDEKQAAAAERLRQQFEAAKIQPAKQEQSDSSSGEEDYDPSLQCDEELRSVPTDEELMKAKLLNRIKQVEAELTEAREDLVREQTTKTSWAEAGDVEDAELRVECLEEQVNRIKKKL